MIAVIFEFIPAAGRFPDYMELVGQLKPELDRAEGFISLEHLQLAARAQHVERWKTPRESYPAGREGYLQWRTYLYGVHAETSGRLLAQAGYDAATIGRVKSVVAKKMLRADPEAQLLEDVVALVFLENYLGEFAAKHGEYEEAKFIDILGKTWRKMSPRAREFAIAGGVKIPPDLMSLLKKAAMFKRIDHIELVTADPERAERFYTGVLGFKVRSRDRVPASPMGPLDLVYLDLGGTTVELICYPEGAPAAAPAGERLGYRMMALEVVDMGQALGALKKQGIEAAWGPKTRPTYARAEIRDPDGNAIELRQWISRAS